VEDAHCEGKFLQRGSGHAGVVDVGTEEEDERVYEEGAKVFDDEDGAPGYLGAWET